MAKRKKKNATRNILILLATLAALTALGLFGGTILMFVLSFLVLVYLASYVLNVANAYKKGATVWFLGLVLGGPLVHFLYMAFKSKKAFPAL